MRKILINAVTLEGGNIIPLLLKIKYWQSIEWEIVFLGTRLLKEQIDSLGIVKKYDFMELGKFPRAKGRIEFILQGLKKNFLAIFYLNKIKNKYDVIYSISSTLDLVLFPFLMKKIDKRVKWAAVFDNIVPFNDPGNKLIRLLSGVFFRISLLLLRRADKIFTISPALKSFLLKQGFRKERLVVTGNAVENDLIAIAQKNSRYNIDALFVGRINETKGIYDMLEVLARVKKKIPNFQLAIMGGGDDPTVERFKDRIEREKLKENIQFLGYKTGLEKFNIIKSSKCFWFFSRSVSESFGIALLEAVCCGVPAFAYDLEPYRDIYKNNEIKTFEKDKAELIANEVVELFERKEFNNKEGEALLGKYSWDKIAEIEAGAF